MIDAVKAQKPVLTLNVNLQADYLLNSEACCRSYDEFLEKAHRILTIRLMQKKFIKMYMKSLN